MTLANGLDDKKRDQTAGMFRKVMRLFGVVFLFLVEILRKGYHII